VTAASEILPEWQLTGTFDAKVWARQFMLITAANPAVASDEETMLGWFANAIMSGYDHAKREDVPVSAELDHSAALVRRECAEEIRNEADKVESRTDADPARLRTYADGMRRAAAVLLLGQRAEEARIP